MESKQKKMSQKTYYARKIKRASHLLFYRHHRKPGVKGWELKKAFGSDYPKVIDILNSYIEKLDLQIQTIFEEEKPKGKPTMNQLDKARFYITLKNGLTTEETRLIGWRIDDIAGLAITISFIFSKKGKASRKEIEDILRSKLPGWRVDMNLRRYIRSGYIAEDNGQLYLDWRTRAEIDQKLLIELLLGSES
jgi:hypothetical protein